MPSDYSHNFYFNSFRLAQIIKDLVSPYLLIVFSMSYLILSIAGLCILIESKDGWFEAIARSITYPSYFMGILVIWTYLGEYFTDTVSLLSVIRLKGIIFLNINPLGE